MIIQKSGLYQYHKKEAGEKGKTRIENLEELVTSAKTLSNLLKKKNLTKRLQKFF